MFSSSEPDPVKGNGPLLVGELGALSSATGVDVPSLPTVELSPRVVVVVGGWVVVVSGWVVVVSGCVVVVDVEVEVDVEFDVKVVVVLVGNGHPPTFTFLSELISLPTNWPDRSVLSPSAI